MADILVTWIAGFDVILMVFVYAIIAQVDAGIP